jgi:hypothetical protein
MTLAAPSVLMDELVERVKAALDINNVLYGPPENVPSQKMAWVRYGDRSFEYGMFSTEFPSISITIAVPSNGMYPNEYRLVNDLTNSLAMALLPPTLIGGELPITGIEISEPVRSSWAGQEGAMMAAEVRLISESKEINSELETT